MNKYEFGLRRWYAGYILSIFVAFELIGTLLHAIHLVDESVDADRLMVRTRFSDSRVNYPMRSCYELERSDSCKFRCGTLGCLIARYGIIVESWNMGSEQMRRHME